MNNETQKNPALDDLDQREFNDGSIATTQIETQPIAKPISLGKAKGFEEDLDEPSFLPGYIEIFAQNFPTKGIFYGKDARFLIRAATVTEIKQFSTISEDDPYSIDEALNQVLKSCLTYREGSSMRSFKDLKEEDRIYIIMAVRELTFVKGENDLIINYTCKECGTPGKVEVRSTSFESNEPGDKIMKYYDEDSREFIVQTKSNGSIVIAPPSVGIMMEVTKWIQKQQQEGKKLDKSFLKTLPYMLKDWRGLNEKVISNMQIEYMSWDLKLFQTMNSLIDMCKVGVKENLTVECEKCQAEVTVPISFPSGIRSLFVVSDIDSELL